MTQQFLACNNKGINDFVDLVKSGAVVVFPTDTVYGIGCDPYNDESVHRIFSIKQRDALKSLPV